MYSMANRGPAQKQPSVTITVSAIDGIQMPQAPMPQQPMAPAQAPQAAPVAPAQPEDHPASEQAKTAFVASLEAIRQYHMATDPAEKEKWKVAADNLHKIVENDGPQMMSCKFEYTALMALPNTKVSVPDVDPNKPKPKPRPSPRPLPPTKVTVPSTAPAPKMGKLVASGPAGNMKPTAPGQNANSNDVRTPPNSQQPALGKKPEQKPSEPSEGAKPKTPGVVDGNTPDPSKTSVGDSPTNPVINPRSQQAGDPAIGPKSPASEGVVSNKEGLGLSPRSIDKQGQEQRNLSLVLQARKLTAGGKYSSKVLAGLAKEAAANPPDEQTVYKIAQDTGVNPTYAIQMAKDSYKQSEPKEPTQLPEGYKVASESQQPQENAPDKASEQPDVVKPEDEVRQETPEAKDGNPQADTPDKESLNSEAKVESTPPPLPDQGKKAGTPPPLPNEQKAKPADPLQVKKDKLKKSFDQDTVNKQANTIGTLTNAADVATAGIRGLRSVVNGDTQGVVGNLKNAADIRQGQRNDQKIIAERKDEAETDKARWNSVVDKVNQVDGEPLTDTEAVGAKRAFKRYDLPRKKAIADALGIENANDLTSDELNVEVDKLFDAKRPKSIGEEAKYKTILNQHNEYANRTAGDKEGTFTPDEARSFKNDLRQLDYPDLAALAEKYGLNPTSSRNLLINQMKSIIDSKEEGRVKREKAREGSAGLLGEQVGRLRMGLDEETQEEYPEAPISQSQARGMASTFGKQPPEEQKAMLATLGVPEEEIANLDGNGLKDRFTKELQKHTIKPKTRGQEIQGGDTLDIADQINAKMSDPESKGISYEDFKTFMGSLPKDEKELREIGVAMGVEGAADLGITRLRVKIGDRAASAIQRDKEEDPLDNGIDENSNDIDALAEHLASNEDNVLTKANAAILKKSIPSGDFSALKDMSEKLGLNTVNQLNSKPFGPLALEENIKEFIASRTEKPAKAEKATKGKVKADEPKPEVKDDDVPVITPEEDEGGDATGGETADIKPKTPNPTTPEADIPIPAPEDTKPSDGENEIPKSDSGPSTESRENKAEPIDEKPAKQVEIEGKEPEAIRPTPKTEEKPKATLRAVASELGLRGETRNKKGVLKHIGQEHMPKILKAYFDADFSDSPDDKELQDERRKAWGQVSNDKAIQDAIIAQQPEDIEAALDAIHSNMTSNDLTGEKNDILFGDKLTKVREQVEGKRKVQSETADSNKPADAFPKPIEKYSNYAKVAEQDRQWTNSPNQLRQAAAQLSTIAHQRHGTAAKGVEGDKERDEARAIMDRASALMDLYREVASGESKDVSEGIKAKAAAKPKAAPKPKAKKKPEPEKEPEKVDPVVEEKKTESPTANDEYFDYANPAFEKPRKAVEKSVDEYFDKNAGADLIRFDKLYELLKESDPDLTVEDFRNAVQSMHHDPDSKFRLANWGKSYFEIPGHEGLKERNPTWETLPKDSLTVPKNKNETPSSGNAMYYVSRKPKS